MITNALSAEKNLTGSAFHIVENAMPYSESLKCHTFTIDTLQTNTDSLSLISTRPEDIETSTERTLIQLYKQTYTQDTNGMEPLVHRIRPGKYKSETATECILLVSRGTSDIDDYESEVTDETPYRVTLLHEK
jgi:hypothetical protein